MITEGTTRVTGQFHNHKFTGVITRVENSLFDTSVTLVHITFDKPVKVNARPMTAITMPIRDRVYTPERMYPTDYLTFV